VRSRRVAVADAAPPKAKGRKPKGKVVLYSVLGLGGVAVAYYLYTRYEANAATGTTGSTSTPADTTPATTTVGASTPPAPTTIAAWKQAIIDYAVANGLKGGENVAAQGLADALSGHCVGPNEYAALNGAFGAIGQPPGGNTIILKQCGSAAKPPTTTGHTPTSTPKSGTTSGTASSVAHRASATVTRRDNAIDAARRRANDLAAAGRRQANNAARAARRFPRTRAPQIHKG
jgi:hypothetical protein